MTLHAKNLKIHMFNAKLLNISSSLSLLNEQWQQKLVKLAIKNQG